MEFYEIRGNKIFYAFKILATDKPYQDNPVGVIYWRGEYLINGHEFIMPGNDEDFHNQGKNCFDEIQTISEDGNKITECRTGRNGVEKHIFLREK